MTQKVDFYGVGHYNYIYFVFCFNNYLLKLDAPSSPPHPQPASNLPSYAKKIPSFEKR